MTEEDEKQILHDYEKKLFESRIEYPGSIANYVIQRQKVRALQEIAKNLTMAHNGPQDLGLILSETGTVSTEYGTTEIDAGVVPSSSGVKSYKDKIDIFGGGHTAVSLDIWQSDKDKIDNFIDTALHARSTHKLIKSDGDEEKDDDSLCPFCGEGLHNVTTYRIKDVTLVMCPHCRKCLGPLLTLQDRQV